MGSVFDSTGGLARDSWPSNTSASNPPGPSDYGKASPNVDQGTPNESVRNWRLIVLRDLRLPRVLLAVLIGGSLAVSGLVMQAIFRNPLADPDYSVCLAVHRWSGDCDLQQAGLSLALVVPMSAFGVALICANWSMAWEFRAGAFT